MCVYKQRSIKKNISNITFILLKTLKYGEGERHKKIQDQNKVSILLHWLWEWLFSSSWVTGFWSCWKAQCQCLLKTCVEFIWALPVISKQTEKALGMGDIVTENLQTLVCWPFDGNGGVLVSLLMKSYASQSSCSLF